MFPPHPDDPILLSSPLTHDEHSSTTTYIDDFDMFEHAVSAVPMSHVSSPLLTNPHVSVDTDATRSSRTVPQGQYNLFHNPLVASSADPLPISRDQQWEQDTTINLSDSDSDNLSCTQLFHSISIPQPPQLETPQLVPPQLTPPHFPPQQIAQPQLAHKLAPPQLTSTQLTPPHIAPPQLAPPQLGPPQPPPLASSPNSATHRVPHKQDDSIFQFETSNVEPHAPLCTTVEMSSDAAVARSYTAAGYSSADLSPSSSTRESSTHRVAKPIGKGGRRTRRYSSARSSRYCHLCARHEKSVPMVGCSNVKQNICQKSVCVKCIERYGLSSSEQNWVCPHCQGKCPPRAKCFAYDRQTAQRRERTIRTRLSNDILTHRTRGTVL